MTTISIIVRVWRWRRLTVNLAWREFRSRYAGSVLGSVWAVLEPALQLGLYLVVFGYLVGTTFAQPGGVGAYVLYLVTGLLPFLAFQESMVRAAGLIRAQASVVRHVNVPLEVLLAGGLLSVFARYAIAMVLVVAATAAAGALATSQLVWMFPAVLLLVALTWGFALVLVPVGVFIPDVGQIVATVTSVLFYLTPIVYTLDHLSPRWVRLLSLNPLTGVVDLFRVSLVGGRLVVLHLVVAGVAPLVALLIGSTLFTWHAKGLRDLV
jgi:lipopolysaccharide transport system permease protein